MKGNIKNDECHSVLKLTYITFSSDLDKLSTSLSSQLLVTTVLLTAIVLYRTPMINRSIYFIWNNSVSWVRFFLLILEYKWLLYSYKCSSLKNLDGNTVNDEYHFRDVCWKKKRQEKVVFKFMDSLTSNKTHSCIHQAKFKQS